MTAKDEATALLASDEQDTPFSDVEELHGWIVRHFEDEEVAGQGRELWERVGEAEFEGDGEMAKCVRVMREETEEGKKVERPWRKREVAPV